MSSGDNAVLFGYYGTNEHCDAGESMKLFEHIHQATFTNRPNRFIVECEIDGRRVRAYLPNPGRLWELLLPGSMLYLT